ncbi:MAG: TolC family protein [Paludibaculum sp.]
MPAQPAPRRLTLAEAEQLALKNHPRIGSATLRAQAAEAQVTQARSAYEPLVTGSLTGSAADHGSIIAAGMLQTSSLYSRVAAGVSITQLVTDFGRTSKLAESARLNATARGQSAVNARAEILVQVDLAYCQALASDAVLRVSRAVVDNRRLILRQVKALAQSSLKSTLDVSFADVAASDAELALVRAENDAAASRARLVSAMGGTGTEEVELADLPVPTDLPADANAAVTHAMEQRPDLAALKLDRTAAHRFADAEGALNRPTVSLLGTAGALPASDPRLPGTYSAAGVNVNIPVWNGRLFSARHAEARLRAEALDRDVEDLSVRVTEQVRVTWLEANTAFRRLAVTERLVAQAEQTLRLAQVRYDSGLGSMVELNQAQVAQVSAEIAAANAKYEFLSRRAGLAFVMGDLR